MNWKAGYCVWYNQRVQLIDSYVSPAKTKKIKIKIEEIKVTHNNVKIHRETDW